MKVTYESCEDKEYLQAVCMKRFGKILRSEREIDLCCPPIC
jgi:hypothetical protein